MFANGGFWRVTHPIVGVFVPLPIIGSAIRLLENAYPITINIIFGGTAFVSALLAFMSGDMWAVLRRKSIRK